MIHEDQFDENGNIVLEYWYEFVDGTIIERHGGCPFSLGVRVYVPVGFTRTQTIGAVGRDYHEIETIFVEEGPIQLFVENDKEEHASYILEVSYPYETIRYILVRGWVELLSCVRLLEPLVLQQRHEELVALLATMIEYQYDRGRARQKRYERRQFDAEIHERERNERNAKEREARKCPTCASPAPHLYPAVQFEGEVGDCLDIYHRQITAENTAEKISDMQRLRTSVE